jgi:hypothetical protein
MWLTKKIRFVLAILLLTLPLFGRSYTTSFASPPAPENPISEGSNWINGKATGLDWNNIKTTAGFAQTAQTLSASGFDDGTALVTGTWGPDQTVTITAKGPSSLGGTQEVEIRLRSTMTAHNSTGYEVDFTKGGLALVRWNGPGPFTSTCCFTQLATANTVWQNGDVLKATIIGTVITVYRNGTQVLTHDTAGDTAPTDGSGGAARYSTGLPGFGIDINSATASTDFGITSFTATDGLATTAPAAPTGLTAIVN